MVEFLLVGVGGAIGSVARYGVWRLIEPRGSSFTWATFLVNITGSFVLGLIVGLLAGRLDERIRALFFFGLLGGFTTFSTFTVDTVALWRAGLHQTAVVNVLFSVFAGIVAAYVGLLAGDALNQGL